MLTDKPPEILEETVTRHVGESVAVFRPAERSFEQRLVFGHGPNLSFASDGIGPPAD